MRRTNRYNTDEFSDQRHQFLTAEAKGEGFHSRTRRRAERGAERGGTGQKWKKGEEGEREPASGVQLLLPLASTLPVTLPHLPNNLRNSSNKVKAFPYRYNNKNLITVFAQGHENQNSITLRIIKIK